MSQEKIRDGKPMTETSGGGYRSEESDKRGKMTIEQAVKIIKIRKPCEERFKAESVLLSLAEEYFKIVDLPNEKLTYEHRSIKIGNTEVTETDSRYNSGFNDCLQLCKLVYLKQQDKIHRMKILMGVMRPSWEHG